MKISIFKSILIGLLVGVLIAIATKFILVLLIIVAIFKLSGKWNKSRWAEKRMDFIDKIRSMSDEEFNNFKEGFNGKHRCHSHCSIK